MDLLLPQQKFSDLNMNGNNLKSYFFYANSEGQTLLSFWFRSSRVHSLLDPSTMAGVPSFLPAPLPSPSHSLPLALNPLQVGTYIPGTRRVRRKCVTVHETFKWRLEALCILGIILAQLATTRSVRFWQISEMKASVGTRLKENIWGIQLWFWLTSISDYP